MNLLIALAYDLSAYCIKFEDELNKLHKQRINKAKRWLYLKTGIEL